MTEKRHNAAVYILSSRTNTLKKALEYFYKNWNNKYDYPVYIHHFDDIYSEDYISDVQKNISDKITFHQIDYGVPSHIKEEELFYNRSHLQYVRTSFPKSRLGYLHMEHFSSNLHKFGEKGCIIKEMEQYDYIMRIDDDSWFKESIDFDFFDHVQDQPIATAFTWNHCGLNHLETRENLWDLYLDYLKLENIDPFNIKNQQLREAVLDNDDMKMHTLKWSCGNFNIYNVKMFLDSGFAKWMDYVNEHGGLYKHRWGDLETLGVFTYTMFEDPVCDLDLRNKGLYEPKLPETEVPVSGYAPSVQGIDNRI
jgi:hypothetical protein